MAVNVNGVAQCLPFGHDRIEVDSWFGTREKVTNTDATFHFASNVFLPTDIDPSLLKKGRTAKKDFFPCPRSDLILSP